MFPNKFYGLNFQQYDFSVMNFKLFSLMFCSGLTGKIIAAISSKGFEISAVQMVSHWNTRISFATQSLFFREFLTILTRKGCFFPLQFREGV